MARCPIGPAHGFCYNWAEMTLPAAAQYVPALLVQALLLMIVSRMLFRGMVCAFANRNGGGLVTLLRLPGNLLHETSHALGYLLLGYRVRHLIPCVFDPKQSGVCVRGKPWSPVTLPWLADGAAALMPLIVGTVALVAVGQWLGIINHHAAGLNPATTAVGGTGLFRAAYQEIVLLLQSLDWHHWQTYVFLYLALSIGAEVSPSPTDLRYAIPALAGLAVGVLMALITAQHLEGLNQLLETAGEWLQPHTRRLAVVWGVALVLMLSTAALTLPVTFVIHSLRPPR